MKNKFFPIINFVDQIPDLIFRQCIRERNYPIKNNGNDGMVTSGCFVEDENTIWILKGEKQFLILLHELTHWFIYIITKRNKTKSAEIFLDKCLDIFCSIKIKFGKIENKQLEQQLKIRREKK